MNTNLFVYGSLRNGFESPAYAYMASYFNFVTHARVKGLLYDLGEYPAAVPDNGEHYIVGELYTLKTEEEMGWALAQLDDYEGVNPGEDEAGLYRRELTEVFRDDNGEIETAWIYWYDRVIVGSPLVASGDVLEYIRSKK